MNIDYSKYVTEHLDNGIIKLTPKVSHPSIISSPNQFTDFMALHKPGIWLILGCIHFPFHHVQMWEAVLHYIEKNKNRIAGIILNGDLIDAFSVSAHNTGMWQIPGLTLQKEYDATNKELDRLDSTLKPGTTVVVNEGNHDNRILRFKKAVDHAKLGGAVKDYSEGLHFKERGYFSIRPYNRARVQLGQFLVTHGLYTGKNAAKKHVLKFGTSTIHNHTHGVGMYMGTNMKIGLEAGWMGNPHSEVFSYASWASIKDWKNAFAWAYQYPSGKVDAKIVPWESVQFYVGDKSYSA